MTTYEADPHPTDPPVCPPGLGSRPLRHTVEHTFPFPSDVLYRAWTEQFDLWFAAPGSVLMKAEVNAPFFFETRYHEQRHPHYGRFLRLERDRLVELTWVTGAGGTTGAETVITVELIPLNGDTLFRLTHAGWPDEESRRPNEEAWPFVFEQLEQRLTEARSQDTLR